MAAPFPPPPASKAEWRREFRRRLRTVPDPSAASDALVARLDDFLASRPPRVIAAFASLPGEPQLVSLIRRLAHHTWAFPRVDGETLAFHQVRSVDDLAPGAFGILEPAPDLPPIDPAAIDLFLCPGLGFGLDGSRLGRGKGYYDRALAGARPDALRIGVAFAEQVAPGLPVDPHDLPMTHLATPAGLHPVP